MKKTDFKFLLIVSLALLLLSTPSLGNWNYGKEKSIEPSKSNPGYENKEVIVVLPFGYENKTLKELKCFWEEMTKERINELVENRRVVNYLAKIGKIEDVSKQMCEGDLYSQLDLTNYLTKEELIELNEYTINAQDKVCMEWQRDGFELICFNEVLGFCIFGKECMKFKRLCWIPGSSWHWEETKLDNCVYFP